MKFLNLILAAVMFVQVNSSFAAVSANEIQNTFAKIRYDLENGKFQDSAELEKAATEATSDLLAGGASASDLLKFVKNNIKDGQKKADFEAMMNVLKIQDLSDEQVLSKLNSFFADTANEGASYRVRRTVYVHVTWPVILIVVTIYVIRATAYRTTYYY